MKRILILIATAALVLASTGCLALSKRQLEGNLPQISAGKAHVHVTTIYGVSGDLRVTNLRYENGQKKADEYDLTYDTPLGTVKVETEGASVAIKKTTTITETVTNAGPSDPQPAEPIPLR